MKILSWQQREYYLRFLYFNSEFSKLVLKSLLSSSFFSTDDKFFFFLAFQKFFFKASITFFRRSCLNTGFSKSVFRLFKLTRQQLKNLASSGAITGLRKSSF